MLKNLQTSNNEFANGMNTASVDMKRGAFVTVDEATHKLSLANGIAGAFMVNRGFKLTPLSAMGYPVSDFDEEQDLIKAGEHGYLNVLEGRWATSEFDSTKITDSTTVGTYLDIKDGKLTTEGVAGSTIIKFIGWRTVGDHKLCGVEFVPTVKLA